MQEPPDGPDAAAVPPVSRRPPVMFPKEHGAYGQLTFPLLSAFVVCGAAPSSVLAALAAAAAFIAHEPMLVMLGRRGARARREDARRAAVWLGASGLVAFTSGMAALWLAPPGAHWSFLFPAVPAAFAAVTLLMGREKTTAGELLVAAAFSLMALPVCRVNGAAFPTGLTIGLVFAVHFAATTLGVRVVVLKVRGGGDRRGMRLARRLLAVVLAAAVALVTWARLDSALPWPALMAMIPGLLISVGVATHPPAARHLRTIGWGLVASSAAAAIILVLTLRP